MSQLATRLRALVQYARVMQSPADMYRYARLRTRYGRGVESGSATIRLRSLGGAGVICRSSQDVYTFKHTFLAGYHLPPVALPPDATIVDLGSNVGFTVADFAHRYPQARIVGVEMDRRNFELACSNTARYGGRVTLLHAAVWTHDGVVHYAGDADDAFHVAGEEVAAVGSEANATRTAPAKRIATVLEVCGVDRVDYMKIDIEGAEGAIFAEPIEWARRVRSMKIEVHAPVTTAFVASALTPLGFACWDDTRHPACLCAIKR